MKNSKLSIVFASTGAYCLYKSATIYTDGFFKIKGKTITANDAVLFWMYVAIFFLVGLFLLVLPFFINSKGSE